jgi:hypothetical protein
MDQARAERQDSNTRRCPNALLSPSMLSCSQKGEQHVDEINVDPCGILVIKNCRESILNLNLPSGSLRSIKYNQRGGKEYYKPRLESSFGHLGDVIGSKSTRLSLVIDSLSPCDTLTRRCADCQRRTRIPRKARAQSTRDGPLTVTV